jgi:hypothetical protein
MSVVGTDPGVAKLKREELGGGPSPASGAGGRLTVKDLGLSGVTAVRWLQRRMPSVGKIELHGVPAEQTRRPTPKPSDARSTT